MTIQDEQQLNSFYRKQLRRILTKDQMVSTNYMKKQIQNLCQLRWPEEDGTYLDTSSDYTKKAQPEKPWNSCLKKDQIRNSELEKEQQFTPQ